jgi:hypothetical protein
MDNQGWIDVPTRRRTVKKEQNSEFDSKTKLNKEDIPFVKKRIRSELLQQLIRKRIQLKVNQEKADTMCSFPRHTFKNIESNRFLPNDNQIQRIQRVFDVLLVLDDLPE